MLHILKSRTVWFAAMQQQIDAASTPEGIQRIISET